MDQLLLQMGLNVSSSFVYDWLKSYFVTNPRPTRDTLILDLASALHVSGASLCADKIISFLAKHGDIEISGSRIFVKDAIVYETKGHRFAMRDDTTSETG
ncbi:MAG: hypothetical protein AAB898_01735, partial [Patescibacteria group bacterium]